MVCRPRRGTYRCEHPRTWARDGFAITQDYAPAVPAWTMPIRVAHAYAYAYDEDVHVYAVMNWRSWFRTRPC